ncbi:unnamed protein product [Nezara viridula]|uniref:Transient receptor ion channel domain-containing protein n=1 Tax=Nezara viridula TaxID=85310 RepID=A0A9P0H173_NEZVI|nr:unnamed protein product [Nezara viridula]
MWRMKAAEEGTAREVRMEGGEQVLGLTPVEKKFLLLAERGDCATVRKYDSLLHAIKEEYVEAVEVLLEWEESIHVPGEPYSWEALDRSSSNFTPDITPLILAAHMNNYEILKILLDRGASLPIPHDIRCACDECVQSREQDSLRHSQSRINAYRALSSSSLIALSSRDPILTAFKLSWELRRMSRLETEFRAEYNVGIAVMVSSLTDDFLVRTQLTPTIIGSMPVLVALLPASREIYRLSGLDPPCSVKSRDMREQCQVFATSLLDHARTSLELEIMLNYDPEAGPGDVWQPGERQTLERLKLAIKFKQKKVKQLYCTSHKVLPKHKTKTRPRRSWSRFWVNKP